MPRSAFAGASPPPQASARAPADYIWRVAPPAPARRDARREGLPAAADSRDTDQVSAKPPRVRWIARAIPLGPGDLRNRASQRSRAIRRTRCGFPCPERMAATRSVVAIPRRPRPAVPREQARSRRLKWVKNRSVSLVSAVVNVCVCVAFAAACARTPTTPTQPAASQPAIRVLMLTATAGFRHDFISTARDVLTSIGPANGFAITATEDLSAFTTSNLAALMSSCSI